MQVHPREQHKNRNRGKDQHPLREVTRNSLDTRSQEVGEREVSREQTVLALVGVGGLESLDQGLNGKEWNGTFWSESNVLYLDGSVVTQVNKFVKIHPTVLLKLQHDIACKLYLNKRTDPKSKYYLAM